MALTFSRQYAEGSMGTGAVFGGVAVDSDTLRYLVPGNTKADALANVDLQALIASGTHPDGISGLFLQAANPTERVGAGSDVGWYVDVVYGKNRMSGSDVRVTPPDRTSPDYRLDSTSSRIEIIEVPLLAEYQTEAMGPTPGGGPLFLYTYNRIDLRRVLPMTQYMLKLNTNTFGSAQVEAITKQTGKIHEFGNRKWLFESGQMSEVEEGVYSITYVWKHDPGTPFVLVETGPGDPVYFLVTPTRGPFQEYIIEPYKDGNDNQRFRVKVRDTYEEDLLGWASLPGNPVP